MSKLFALENINENTTDTELEAAAEVGEVADVQVEIQEEITDANKTAEAIDEGIDAADQLEEVEEMVANAAEEEGLNPVAAEAIRIAVEAICARVGANPKVMYPLYAAENFPSASSRKANAEIALESISEFLKNIWNKIKTVIQNLWNKVKEFWDKHFSKLGRIKKALESMREKISESSGKLKSKPYIEEAPSGLSDAFGGGDISTNVIKNFIDAHEGLVDSVENVSSRINSFNIAASNLITNNTNKSVSTEGRKNRNRRNRNRNISSSGGGNTGSGNTSDNNTVNTNDEIEKNPIEDAINLLQGDKEKTSGPLVGGLIISYKFEIDDDGNVTLDITRDYDDKKDKGGVVLAEKNDVKDLLTKTLNLINDNIKAKAKQDKLQESFNKLSVAVEKAINNTKNEESQKALRKSMRAVYKINAKAPVIQTEFLNLNVKLAKAVISYAALCLKNYK